MNDEKKYEIGMISGHVESCIQRADAYLRKADDLEKMASEYRMKARAMYQQSTTALGVAVKMANNTENGDN